jgi:hypothetical protein
VFTNVNVLDAALRRVTCGHALTARGETASHSRIIGGMGEALDLAPRGARFNFGRELRKARRALEERVAAYAAKHPELGYRDLRVAFGLSLGALSKIMRRRKKTKASRDLFVVRHEYEGQKLITVVTLTGRASVEHKRLRLAELYRTQDIVEGDDQSILRRVEYTVQELGMGRWHGRKKV